MFSFASDKRKFSAEKFSKNSNLGNSEIYLPAFRSRTNLKLPNILVSPKFLITNLDSSKAPGPNCIPAIVTKNCMPERSYIATELFNMCLKALCFPDCCKSHLWTLYLSMLRKIV